MSNSKRLNQHIIMRHVTNLCLTSHYQKARHLPLKNNAKASLSGDVMNTIT
jgi:hypothetical protein